MHCTTQLCTTLHYSTLHFSILHYITLHCTTLHYSSLHFSILHYTTLLYTILHYTFLHCTTLHYTALHYTTFLNTTLNCTSQYCSALHYTTLISLRYTYLFSTTHHCSTLHYTFSFVFFIQIIVVVNGKVKMTSWKALAMTCNTRLKTLKYSLRLDIGVFASFTDSKALTDFVYKPPTWTIPKAWKFRQVYWRFFDVQEDLQSLTISKW